MIAASPGDHQSLPAQYRQPPRQGFHSYRVLSGKPPLLKLARLLDAERSKRDCEVDRGKWNADQSGTRT